MPQGGFDLHVRDYSACFPQGYVDLRGIKRLTIFSRKMVFSKDSQLDLRAPKLVQNFNILSPGSDGDDGKHGVHGPTGELRTARNLRLLSSALFRMWLV